MPKDSSDALRQHLANLLHMEGAHLTFHDAVSRFPEHLRGVKPPGAPHSAWQLVEHMRLAQFDILDFSRNPDYQEKKFPDDYWPADEAPPKKDSWSQSVRQFEGDMEEMQALIADPKNDLFEPLSHGEGQTLLREALLVADHNSYHLGQLMFLRKTLE